MPAELGRVAARARRAGHGWCGGVARARRSARHSHRARRAAGRDAVPERASESFCVKGRTRSRCDGRDGRRAALVACRHDPSHPPPRRGSRRAGRGPGRCRSGFDHVHDRRRIGFTVPAGVHIVDVSLTGARGGRAHLVVRAGAQRPVQGSLPVTPGDRLYAVVGGAGTDFTGGNAATSNVGGANGGGSGFAGGGGASDHPDGAGDAGEPAGGRRRRRRSRRRRIARGRRGRARRLEPQPGGRRTARDAGRTAAPVARRTRAARTGPRGARPRRRRHGAEFPRRRWWRRAVRRWRRRRRDRVQPVRVRRRWWRRFVARAGRRDPRPRGADRRRPGDDRLRRPGRRRQHDAPRVPGHAARSREPEPDDRGRRTPRAPPT